MESLTNAAGGIPSNADYSADKAVHSACIFLVNNAGLINHNHPDLSY